MSRRSFLQTWVRWTGAPQAPPLPETAGPNRRWVGTPDLPAPLRHLAESAILPPEVEAALARHRAVLKALAASGGGTQLGQALADAQAALSQIELPPSLGVTIKILLELFTEASDLVLRGLVIGGRRAALLLYVDGMVDGLRLETSVLQPLTQWDDADQVPLTPDGLRAWADSVAVATGQTGLVRSVREAVDAVLTGCALLLVDGVGGGVTLELPGWAERSPEEPPSEQVLRGPRDGFNETLRTNTALLRRRLRTPALKLEQITLGRVSNTPVVIAYLADVASPDLVAEVKRRLERVDIDGFTDPSFLEEFIEDQPSSLFPQVQASERPDTVAFCLMEGQVAILCEGSSYALLAPVTFWAFLQSSEDYYNRFQLATALRWLRYLLLFLALTGPSFYIAIVTFHQEMLPTPLLLTIAAAREGIPFPVIVEAVGMEIFFEALQEAGVRLPRSVGQAVSIVGALVIGQAAVQAGIVSAPIVIIVAATGIAFFTIPRYTFSAPIRLLRFPLMFLAGSLGLFGVMAGLIVLLIHLCSLRSFGVPYLQPVAPTTWRGLLDVLVRAPLWLKSYRATGMGQTNRRRQAPWLKPGPGGGGAS